MEELRSVPPYALFFDFALIPQPNSAEYAKMCTPLKGASFSDSLVQAAAPQIIPNGSTEPLPILPPENTIDTTIVKPVSEDPGNNSSETVENPQAATEASNAIKNPVGALLGANPQAAATDALGKSPVGALLGANPLQALQNPQAAAANALKNPVGSLLGLSAPKKK